MENASKALLIAGAILLVIALIAIGMAILGQGQDVVNSTADNFDALTVEAFNNQFTPYLDRRLSSMEHETLRGIIVANNLADIGAYNEALPRISANFDANTGRINGFVQY